jgi:curved DNA-binding protein
LIGIGHGKRIRVPGKGTQGPGGRGDLYLKINISLPPGFHFDQNGDIIYDKFISYSQACFGASVDIPGLDGGNLKLKVPPGTRCGQKMRLKGRGLPDSKGMRDLFVRIMVDIPKHLTAEQKRIVKELQKAGL